MSSFRKISTLRDRTIISSRGIIMTSDAYDALKEIVQLYSSKMITIQEFNRKCVQFKIDFHGIYFLQLLTQVKNDIEVSSRH